MVTNLIPVAFAAIKQLHAGALDLAWIISIFSSSIILAIFWEFNQIVIGFLLATFNFICFDPEACKILTSGPPADITIDLYPDSTTFLAISNVPLSTPPETSAGTTCRIVFL